jgi:hypothetical protein
VISDKVHRDRQKLALPPLSPLAVDEIEGLLKKTGLNEILDLG